jgi:hypothetical protein
VACRNVGWCWVAQSVPDLYRESRAGGPGPGHGMILIRCPGTVQAPPEAPEYRSAKVRIITLRVQGSAVMYCPRWSVIGLRSCNDTPALPRGLDASGGLLFVLNNGRDILAPCHGAMER